MVIAKKEKVRSKIRLGKADILFEITKWVLLISFALFCLLPVLNVLSLSFSRAGTSVTLLPVDFTLFAYIQVVEGQAFFRALGVSLFVAIAGTFLSVFVLLLAAYPLSKPDLPFRKPIMIFFLITMLFSGGIVPNFLLVRTLGLLDTTFALFIPSLVRVFNLLLLKTYFEGLPKSLEESAMLDGASYYRILLQILLPLSLPIVATVSLFTAVAYWNDYFASLIYQPTRPEYFPLARYIFDLMTGAALSDILSDPQKVMARQNIQAATIVLAIIPVLMIYPLVLKYFTKGITVGAVKG
ncbi:MAG: carbohydrate ABC transporter permease [Firmicutes bacterium]|nr:carbohydrate ABC transporter permease [Bacillota bacterium]